MIFVAVSNDTSVVAHSLDLLCHTLFHVAIENGKVIFNGKEDSISYSVDEFTLEEMWADFYRRRFPTLAGQRGFLIYKADQRL